MLTVSQSLEITTGEPASIPVVMSSEIPAYIIQFLI